MSGVVPHTFLVKHILTLQIDVVHTPLGTEVVLRRKDETEHEADQLLLATCELGAFFGRQSVVRGRGDVDPDRAGEVARVGHESREVLAASASLVT